MLTFLMTTEVENNRVDKGLQGLILGMAAGDKEKLTEFYNKTRAAVYGYTLSILKNGYDAEDILQETYLKAWTSADKYQPKGSAMSWLLTIAKNLSLMKIRDRKKTDELEPEEWAAIPAPDDRVSAEDREVLNKALKILAEDERQIVMLHAVGGLKHREIADLLDIRPSTILSKYSRALKKLRTYIEGADAT